MSFLLGPIDDTVQLADMAADMDHTYDDDLLDATDKTQILPVNSEDDDDLLDPGAAEEVVPASPGDVGAPQSNGPQIPKKLKVATVLVLTCVNLLNYMDRFTIAGE